MDFFTSTYSALRGPTGQPQTALAAIEKLTDRLSQSTLLADRRAALLSLKGLSRDCKADVGEHALEPLLVVLINDAQHDADVAKAVLETLNILCECQQPPEGGKISKDDVGIRHTDVFVASPDPTHALLALLADSTFYTRFNAIQLLTTLLRNRRQPIQAYFLTSPTGPSFITSLLSERREIIRNETLIMLQALLASNPDIQKVLAFEGAFEALLAIISQEGGIEGGVVVQDCLGVIDKLLRFNVSNQNYFRELNLPPLLPPLLLFPSPPPPTDQPVPQTFSLQFWDGQKLANARVVVDIMGMLATGNSPANQKVLEQTGTFRCLLELGLSSNAPTPLKTQALLALPPNLPLAHYLITPYIPVPDTNGEEWDRLPEQSALASLVTLTLEGEYTGVFGLGGTKEARREGIELRVAGLGMFENFVSFEPDSIPMILTSMTATSEEEAARPTPSMLILRALTNLPLSPLTPQGSLRIILASHLFTSLIRSSEPAKSNARGVIPPPEYGDDDDQPPALLSVLLGSLALSFRSRSLAREQGHTRETREWDRIIVAYLIILSVWCWESPASVREVLEEGGSLGVLTEPIAQNSGVDVLVQGLCAFLLGTCYEYNREPGEITRATLHPIIHSRIGTDTFVSRIARLKDDARFQGVGPEVAIVTADEAEGDGEAEVWLNWAFVDFWKGSSYTIQRSITADPNAAPPKAAGSAKPDQRIEALQATLRQQNEDINSLRAQLEQVSQAREYEKKTLEAQVSSLSARAQQLEVELQESNEKRKDVEKEQEDLLVFLEELSGKRRRDKQRMRESGLEVSEDEGEEEDEDEDEE
ncbi:hypothetical protein BOTBODRAFT_27675 [Botryobasidium botryosum FD-172 SS1]|uniref:Vesicle tethering protein Uso1/P115-like head domain-containing protein n=1 Tax=Botryobasidium botryosum (strain FD-172 SS1) TaxID=930990 RepID=A0A067MXB8_BOTB1|nr:hypothetical protein BOTBODRAFT_27675 [Botryobasidium botryosum FD-172 SS1]